MKEDKMKYLAKKENLRPHIVRCHYYKFGRVQSHLAERQTVKASYFLIVKTMFPQVSPLPLICGSNSATASPTPSFRRPSTGFLHPYHAKYPHLHPLSSPEHTSVEDVCEATRGNNGVSASTSSSASSLTSVAAAAISGVISRRTSDNCEPERRPSAITTRYSLFDALDLEYALLKAAARGSVGPYSLSESIHKLTFTQSLAFPALARGLASKRKRSRTDSRSRPINPTGSGLNTFAKVVTASVLVLVSVLVFAVVYKFVRT
ncbi:uncharacterized protein LOC108740022 isoform X4 [Agrilus planipennis]|uniref:Uncharacterized protein LOC108740022 isoform X4 n=1 Tax=Agrilus planipennis TaxID=224129 RepID=A0A1W4X0R4_AGRPL|nr:uncharacterized protein LOC108740022 isoform X4 [Agrilus planipennis]